jgi:pSer/pThr/pTyr-binding forkhead associated (FHA) protein
MRIILQIQPGSVGSRSITIEAGSELRVGRAAPAQLIVGDDQTVSRLHFAIKYDGRTCRIRDLGSTHGTLVNGKPVTDAVIHDGDAIRAGVTTLLVHFEDDAAIERVPATFSDAPESFDAVPPVAPMKTMVPGLTLHDRVIKELGSQKEPLYAILDAARDPMILVRLTECKEEYQSLYEGIEGARLAAYAPYLLALPRGSTFLETIVREGWGKSWGVYLTCDKPFAEVRKHLRRLLTVELEGHDKKMLFRFYDPRVLRVFLPTCTATERAEFFGPASRYVLEGDGPTLVREDRVSTSGLELSVKMLVAEAAK